MECNPPKEDDNCSVLDSLPYSTSYSAQGNPWLTQAKI